MLWIGGPMLWIGEVSWISAALEVVRKIDTVIL